MPNFSRLKIDTAPGERAGVTATSPGLKETPGASSSLPITSNSLPDAGGVNKNMILILVAVGALFFLLKNRKK